MTPTENRTIVITGANSGVGKSTARLLAAEGASVIMVCRNRERGVAAQREIRGATGNDHVELRIADLASLAQVRELGEQLAAEHAQIAVLENNAGVFLSKREITEDGYDSMIPKTMWSVPYSRAVPGRTRGQTTFMVVPSIVASIACYRDNS